MHNLDDLLGTGALPVIAILRGLEPERARAVGGALVDVGIRAIEVPLNSPRPLESIAILARTFGDRALIGAGTVVDPAMVEPLSAAGAKLLVAPNCDPATIAAGLSRGMEVLPGVMTPSEAFAAVAAGARRLKLFPAGSLPRSHVAALKDVLPRATGIWAVGGVTAQNAGAWLEAGVEGIAVGSAIYRPDNSAPEVARGATELRRALAQS
jgi:2-dehydro-3-deoxyphosphogalactonate aldolase